MKKYIVTAETVQELYTIIEANSEEEAMQKAKEVDGGEFTDRDGEYGSWDIIRAVEL